VAARLSTEPFQRIIQLSRPQVAEIGMSLHSLGDLGEHRKHAGMTVL